MKLLILIISMIICVNESQSMNYLPTIPCIRVKYIKSNIPEDVNKFLDDIGIDNFINITFTECYWSRQTHAYITYKSFRYNN
jgi:hypothetical protein